MKDTQMEAGLYCNSCKEELPHHVYYINGKIVRVECQECRRTMVFKVDVLKESIKRSTSVSLLNLTEYQKNIKKI
ncbi:hypothetical protein ABET11_08515 [Priestia megaterium]|uniref:hypothetical protein n=1 Tax=Priestia megaterium TaxID=1404 RepID=UPI0020D2693C|nr:hypothetical protein [Priestia megaterium]